MSEVKTISDLRAVLFQSIQDLRNGTIDVAKAKQIASSAQTIINASKVEMDFLKIQVNAISSIIIESCVTFLGSSFFIA